MTRFIPVLRRAEEALGAAAAARSAVGLYLRPDALGEPVGREVLPVFFLAGTCGVAGVGAGLLALQGTPAGGTAAWAAVRDAAVTASLGLTLTLALALAGLHLHRRAREIAWAREGRPGLHPGEGGLDPDLESEPERKEEDR